MSPIFDNDDRVCVIDFAGSNSDAPVVDSNDEVILLIDDNDVYDDSGSEDCINDVDDGRGVAG